MAEDMKLSVQSPGVGNRNTLELYRDTVNGFRVLFRDNADAAVPMNGRAIMVAGKEHESDAGAVFSVSGTGTATGSGVFLVSLSGSALAFEVPGIAEFRWYDDLFTSGTPAGRFRMPLLIHEQLE
jgi:hypothetical protein